MLIENYLSQVKTALIISPVVKSYTTTRELHKELEGYIRVRAVLKNDTKLDIFIYVRTNDKLTHEKYSFHWQTPQGKLIKRWDNAPHHHELDTFPHHIHKGSEVEPHSPVNLFQILKILEDEIG